MSGIDARPVLARRSAPPYQPYEIIRGAFTPRQCDRIIELGTSLPAEPAVLESDEPAGVADETIRLADVAWIAPDERTWWIYDRLARIVGRANRRYGFEVTGFDEDVQFTSYRTPGAFYSWHQDGLDAGVAHRKLSVVVQLSDAANYRGAELQLFEVAEEYDDDERAAFDLLSSERGAAVVFPSFELHRVLPLRSGTRHSLVCWVSGPPFR